MVSPVFQLKAALNEAQKNASLLAEYHELYELQRRRLESQVFMLTEERELWSTAAYSLAMKVCLRYGKTCVKRPLKNRQSKDLYDKWYLNEGRKYCRMLPLEHSAILLTCIQQLLVLKTNFWSF